MCVCVCVCIYIYIYIYIYIMYKWLAALKHPVMMFQSDKCIAHVIPFCLRKHKSI